VNISVIDHDSYPLPYLQTYSLPTLNQNTHLGNIQGITGAENVRFSNIETSSTVNQSHSTMPGFSTEPTHSQTSSSTRQNQTFNEQADVTHSTPSSSQSEAIKYTGFTQYYGQLIICS